MNCNRKTTQKYIGLLCFVLELLTLDYQLNEIGEL